MDVIDQNKAQRVWSRVMNSPVSAEPAGSAAEAAGDCGGSLTAERVMALVKDEQDACAAYRYLAGCVGGCAKKQLLQMAEEERCHAKKLRAYYFLLTGKKACAGPGKPPCVTCVNETLRQFYRKELEDARNYGRLAKLADERACTFETMSRQECAHAHKLYCILQNTL